MNQRNKHFVEFRVLVLGENMQNLIVVHKVQMGKT